MTQETFVFEFGERKTFEVDGEQFSTNQYGHLEVASDSFLAGMLVGSDNLHDELRRLLLKHEVRSE